MNSFGVARSPRSIHLAVGCRKALATIVRDLGQRAFICTDNRFGQDPMLTALADDMRAAGVAVEVYEDTIAELPLTCVTAAAEKARAFGPDVIVGVGGGSCLDIAKVVALLLAYPGPLQDYYGEFKVPGPVLPIIAVPTTAGTGSEATPVAVLADPGREMKVGISSPFLIPQVAICDPELTLSCPPWLTAIAGADAMTHAIEAFTAIRREPAPELPLQHVFVGKNMISDGHARLAIAALAGNLAKAVANGNDLAARQEVMFGALTAGLAFGVAGTAAAHAIQYPIGALTHTAHGLGVATLMPYVMEYNRSAIIPELAEIASLFGVAEAGQSKEERADRAIEAVDGLFRTIGIPRSLADLGLPADRQNWTAEQSMLSTRLLKINPRVIDIATMKQIIAAAYAGDRARLRNL
jgi:alcohol dehydrogenase